MEEARWTTWALTVLTLILGALFGFYIVGDTDGEE